MTTSYDNVINYFKEYDNKQPMYQALVEKILEPEYENLQDGDLLLIIDEVWRMAYQRALSDNFLTEEEKFDLEMIKNLSNQIGTPGFREGLKYKLNGYLNDIDYENKLKKYAHPKPSPWNNENKDN